MTEIQKTPFVRELASSDRKVRDKALDSLTLYLRSKTDLTLLDHLKLWKGLFFCFYHSDRPKTQQSLALTLSYTLIPTLPRPTSLLRFLRAFWITIGRDFHLIDRLRLDKYLFLIRCYVGVGFEVFLKGGLRELERRGSSDHSGDGDDGGKKRKRGGENGTKKTKKQRQKRTEEDSTNGNDNDNDNDNDDDDDNNNSWTTLSTYLTLLEEGPLCPQNFDPDQKPIYQETPNTNSKTSEGPTTVYMPHGPDGLRYHIMDIWIDEMEKVFEFESDDDDGENTGNGNEDDAEKPKLPKNKDLIPMDLLLRPIEKLRRESPYKPVRTRAAQTLDDQRLVDWGFKSREVAGDDEDEDEWGGFD